MSPRTQAAFVLACSTAMASPAFAQNATSAPTAPPAPPPQEVSVVGTRIARTAGSAHVVREKQLDAFKYDDPTAVVTQVPGVYARGEDGFGLRPNIGVRGVNPDRSKKVALMEDGIPFAPAPYSASAAYFFPLMARMVAVRVIKGPAAISYGPQTVGGAIDLVTRAVPQTTSGAIDAALGQYGYGKLHGHVGSGNEKVGFLVEGVHIQSDGFKKLPNDADTGFAHNEWMVKGYWVVDPAASARNEFRLKVTYSDELSNETYLGLSDKDFRADPLRRYGASALDRMQWHRTGIAFSHVLTPGKNVTVTTTVYRNDLARTWRKVNRFRGADLFEVLRDPTSPRNAVYNAVLNGEDGSSADENILIGPNQRDFVAQGVETRVKLEPRTGPLSHRIEYAVRLHQDRVDRRHSEDAFRMSGGQLVPVAAPTMVTAFNDASSEALSMHAIDAITWRSLTVTPGIRLEAIRSSFIDRAAHTTQRSLDHIVLPGVGAFYSIVPPLGVLAGVYRGFSPAPPGSLQGVRPETSVNYEGGLRFVKGSARAEAIAFYNDYSNLTDVCTLSSGCVEQNLDRQFDAGKARIYGLEAFAEHEHRLGKDVHLPFRVSYTVTRAEFLRSFGSEDPIFGNVKAGDEIPYVPRHQVSASVGVDSARASGHVAMLYVAPMREQAGSGAISDALHTDAQWTFDASASLRLLEGISLYGNIRNIFDERDIVSRRPFGARPNAPRWIQVGVKATF
ncbi:TonB-dependent receptor family protein [Pendulispora albinea]|uniref:TonB-dependent receptor n=1 Tax=Pendulispora albinea TaxID=2741071 RepID=A0ABZ2LWP1_9BACT